MGLWRNLCNIVAVVRCVGSDSISYRLDDIDSTKEVTMNRSWKFRGWAIGSDTRCWQLHIGVIDARYLGEICVAVGPFYITYAWRGY